MVNIIAAGELCLPLIQFLQFNKVKVSVFLDATAQQDAQAQLIHFCNYTSVPLEQGTPDELYDWLKSADGRMTFIIGYGHLINIEQISDQQLLYCYNVHFGSLPEYRGANPVFWQIKNGSPELAVTIHRITKKFDDGPVFWNKKIKREQHFSFGTANSILSNITIEGITYIIQNISAQKIIPVIKPDEKAVSKYYPKPGLEEVLIDWRNMKINEIIDLILACNPWNKGAITMLNNREVKVLDAIEVDSAVGDQFPGTIINTDGTLDVQCADNKVLCITMLNIDGTFVPSRDAVFYGLQKGQCFTSTVHQQ